MASPGARVARLVGQGPHRSLHTAKKGKGMYAIIKTGGKQYKVTKDMVITVEKLPQEIGATVELPVIFLNDGKKIVADAATLENAKVTAEVLDQFKGEKVIAFKFQKRKRYKRTKGHRQQLTKLKITDIQAA